MAQFSHKKKNLNPGKLADLDNMMATEGVMFLFFMTAASDDLLRAHSFVAATLKTLLGDIKDYSSHPLSLARDMILSYTAAINAVFPAVTLENDKANIWTIPDNALRRYNDALDAAIEASAPAVSTSGRHHKDGTTKRNQNKPKTQSGAARSSSHLSKPQGT